MVEGAAQLVEDVAAQEGGEGGGSGAGGEVDAYVEGTGLERESSWKDMMALVV